MCTCPMILGVQRVLFGICIRARRVDAANFHRRTTCRLHGLHSAIQQEAGNGEPSEKEAEIRSHGAHLQDGGL